MSTSAPAPVFSYVGSSSAAQTVVKDSPFFGRVAAALANYAHTCWSPSHKTIRCACPGATAWAGENGDCHPQICVRWPRAQRHASHELTRRLACPAPDQWPLVRGQRWQAYIAADRAGWLAVRNEQRRRARKSRAFRAVIGRCVGAGRQLCGVERRRSADPARRHCWRRCRLQASRVVYTQPRAARSTGEQPPAPDSPRSPGREMGARARSRGRSSVGLWI